MGGHALSGQPSHVSWCPLLILKFKLHNKGCLPSAARSLHFEFNIGDNLQLRIERVNNNVAAVTVTDGDGNQLPFPVHIKLRDAGVNVPRPVQQRVLDI